MDETSWEHVSPADCLDSSTAKSSMDNTDEVAAYAKNVTFTINDVEYTLTTSVPPLMTLVDFIRDRVGAKGTKVLCREGGCGACVVVATVRDPNDGSVRTFSVNSCQVLVYSCTDWSIATIEHLGNRYDGYNDIQKILVDKYGTQCGYCSPGMVMSMFGALEKFPKITSEEIEAILDGNICRCTGYRPIMDAFKEFASDAPADVKQRILDIEDSHKVKCGNKGKSCGQNCKSSCAERKAVTLPLFVENGPVQWYQPMTLDGLCRIIDISTDVSYTLVAGNTGCGVFKNKGPYSRYISLSKIPELHAINTTVNPITFGASATLSSCIDTFIKVSSAGASGVQGYTHLREVANHWKLIANEAVRNVGSWAGNLMLRHRNKDFPSDVFLTLTACNTQVTLLDVSTKESSTINITELDRQDFRKQIIISMSIPTLPDNTFFRLYKIARRTVNSHAYVSAAFRFPYEPADRSKVSGVPGIFFTGINGDFVSAQNTSDYLTGKQLSDSAIRKEALRTLRDEIHPSPDPLQGSVNYRRDLALSLLYKTFVWILNDNIPANIQSAGEKLTRVLSRGQQTYDTDPDTYPLGQPIPKIESYAQVSGEAEYVDDIVPTTGELHGAFVQSSQASAKIDSIDPTDALAMPGVVQFFKADDIVGINSFIGTTGGGRTDTVFARDCVHYNGQSIGLIVAEDRETARKAAKLVKVTYSDVKKPVLTIKDAISSGRIQLVSGSSNSSEILEKIKASPHQLAGEIEMGTQFHFMMEPLCARVLPIEDGYNVSCTTQYMNHTQNVVSQVLNISANQINMEVRRLGGGFGGKISRANVLACAAAVAASKLHKAVRITLDLETHMTLVGWRDPYYATYQVGFDDEGKFEAILMKIYADSGFIGNDSSSATAKAFAKNVYNNTNWSIEAYTAFTDTAANTWCRTPGGVQGVSITENVMEHIASYLDKDPLEVRVKNLFPCGPTRKNKFKTDILPMLKEKSAFSERRNLVTKFNTENRWRKRGLTLVPFFYPLNYPPIFSYTVQVMIYEHDGTVAITHGGIEMGQGINTKAAQVAAHVLGINDPSSISVKPSSNVAAANSMVTGGSFGSDLVAHGVKVCCDRLMNRINSVKNALPDPKPNWPQLIKICHGKNLDLCERYWTDHANTKGYNIFGGAVVEVELDVLTGQFITRRVDINEDVGRSMSPYIDIGQIEGSFIMGQGMFTCEEVHFNEDTGLKLSSSTWDYKLPLALDIPEDFRVTFLPPKSSDTDGMLGSKATAEPPFCLTFSIVTALREAITAARKDAGVADWFDTSTPYTVEKIQQLCQVKPIEELV